MAKRKRGFFYRILFFCNAVFAVLLLLNYLLPYIPPKSYPFLAVVDLIMPVLVGINVLFLVYWVLRLRRAFLLPLIVIALGYHYIPLFFQFPSDSTVSKGDGFTLMSYNVRFFNKFKWIKNDTVPDAIAHFVKSQSVDVLCIQEYNALPKVEFIGLDHEATYMQNPGSGMGIFSRFPILKSGKIDFPHSPNKAMFADLLIGKDTVRVFSVHLQSLRIRPKLESLDTKKRERMIKRMKKAFAMQQGQVDLIEKAIKQSPYKTIVCGDLNNPPFSYVYRRLSAGFQDAFVQGGSGFGTTYKMGWLPLRIDVILADDAFKVDAFERYKVKFSDHYPISARLEIR